MKKAFIIFTLFFGWITISAQTLKVSPEKGTIGATQRLTLEYEIQNVDQGNFTPPDLGNNFALIGGPNQYSSMQFTNGKMSSVYKYSIVIQPLKVGKITIQPASFRTRKKNYQSKKVEIMVQGTIPKNNVPNGLAQGQGSTNNSIADEDAENLPAYFFQLEVDSAKYYIGQQISVNYVLYSQHRLHNYNIPDNPNLEGFWVQDLTPQRIEGKKILLGNKAYNKYYLKSYALFPQKTGELELDEMKIEAQLSIPSGRRRGFFSSGTRKNFKLKAKSETVAVYPTPEKGKPDSFSGAVGNFQINVRADKKTTALNEPLTLSIGVIGSGNLKLVDQIDLGINPEDFEVYDPTVSENIYSKNGIVMGTKSFEYLLVPKKEGNLTIPSIPYAYFNPATERYEVKNAPAIAITITESTDSTYNHVQKTVVKDIASIRDNTSLHAAPNQSPLPFLFLGGLYLLPFIALPILVRKKQAADLEAGDVIGRKRKEALDVAKRKLEGANVFKQKNDKKSFYNEIITTIWGYLGDRLNMQTSQLSKENIRSVLNAKNISDGKSNKLLEIIEYCEMAIFAPVKDADNLQKTYDDTMVVIADIEEELD